MPKPDTAPLDLALSRWHEDMHSGEPSREARTLRSQLRRCRTTDDARLIGGLYRVLREGGVTGSVYDSHVLAMMLLPYIAQNSDTREGDEITRGASFAKTAGQEKDGQPRMRDLRFRRLIEHETIADLTLPLIRALRLLKGEAVSLSHLTRDLNAWSYFARSPDAKGSHPRARWAHDYYTASLPA
ncbi:MAG: type I-E CRISPR-associated protein Cse2/CasB [Bacteroidota bacterium]